MRRSEPQELGVQSFLVIAIAVFIGATAALIANDQIRLYRLELEANKMAQQFQKNEAKRAQESNRQREAKERALREKAAAEAQAKRAREEQAAHAKAQERRKEAAWRQFWQPSEACRRDSAQGSCADQHIRARKIFEAQYQDD